MTARETRFHKYVEVISRANQIAASTELDDLLDKMLDLLIAVTGAEAGTLYLYEEASRELVFKVVKGSEHSQRLVGTRIGAGRGVAGHVFNLGRPLFIPNVATNPHWDASFGEMAGMALRTMYCVPLMLHNQPVGIVQLFNLAPDACDDSDEVTLIELLCSRLVIQNKLGATGAYGYDVNAACSGFLYALTTAAAMVAGGAVSRVGVVGADIMTSVLNLEDRTTSVLFGDGAGAVIVERVEEGLGILDFHHRVDGSGGEFLHMPAGGSLRPATAETVAAKEHCIHQSGSEVFKNAVREMADNSKSLLDRNGFTGDQLKLFVPHQANIRIMDAAARRLELDPARMMVNIDRFGNTTAATIPTALHQAVGEGRLEKGDLVALAAFGAGFTWGATLLRWAY